ncbi:MAG TPA: XdhC/CoxI family protein [Iamia sp.]|nr:XdhC/CoxI family protein [Iamia sp.]
MREILDTVDRWRAAGRRVALGRVVDLEGSGPRAAGAAMAVNEDGEVAGSVSGGCVEGAVVAEALDLLGVDRPDLGLAPPGSGSEHEPGTPRIVTFGYSDEDAFAVGLTCGGTVRLFLEALDRPGGLGEVWDRLGADIRERRPVAVATIVDGPGLGRSLLVSPEGTPLGTLGDDGRDHSVVRDAHGELGVARSGLRHYGSRGEADEAAVTVFVESFAPPPQMLVFGAVDFTAALTRVARTLGYRVTVCDAREVFATAERFPAAHEVVVDWPHRLLERVGSSLGPGDAVCVLTHDAKFDVPAIRAALATSVGYIGVMGSRRTHERRLVRLAEEGVADPADLARLHSPIGLDIGARTPEETGVAIVAEIIALRSGRPAPHLRDTTGPIHG